MKNNKKTTQNSIVESVVSEKLTNSPLNESTAKEGKTQDNPAQKRTKKLIFRIIGFSILASLIIFCFLGYQNSRPYEAEKEYIEMVKNNPQLDLIESSTDWIIKPRNVEKDKNLIFVTGGLVNESSYLFMLSKVAVQNRTVVYVPKIKLNLAFLDLKVIDRIVNQYSLNRFYVSGHSLGGVVACYYISDGFAGKNGADISKVDGIVLMASYCDKPINDFKGSVVSVYGSKDEVLDKNKLKQANSFLPLSTPRTLGETVRVTEIEGVNHAQFGNYGSQRGDGTSDLTPNQAIIAITDQIILIKN